MNGNLPKKYGRSLWIVLIFLSFIVLVAILGAWLDRSDDENEQPSLLSRVMGFFTSGKSDEDASPVDKAYDPWKDRPKVGAPKMPKQIAPPQPAQPAPQMPLPNFPASAPAPSGSQPNYSQKQIKQTVDDYNAASAKSAAAAKKAAGN